MSKVPLIIWGGADVCSTYYNESRSKFAQQPDVYQDKKDFFLVKEAIARQQPIIGVCRGAQLLCVAHGGKLWQHTIPKSQWHPVSTNDGKTFYNVTAGHHQIMRPQGNFELIGWNPEETKVYVTDEKVEMLSDCAEIIWYPNTKCLAVQPHPEWSAKGNTFVEWLNEKIKSLNIDYKF